MYRIDFKNGFSDCNDYVFPKKLKWFLMQLRLFNYMDLMKDYKESFFKSFTTNKLSGPFVYYYDGWDFNQFKFDDTDDIKRSEYPGWCWDNFMIYFIKYIIRPSISNFLNNNKLNNDFYHNYAKKYYYKLASSIKNNTVEYCSLESIIVPFETAFNDFLKTNSFEETINELFKIIIYKSNRSVVEFKSTNSNSINKKCNVSIYDLFFRPLFSLKKIRKHIKCEDEAEHPFAFQFDKTISDYPVHSSFKIHYDDIKYKQFLNCVNTEKITEVDFKKIKSVTNYTVLYTVLKQIIRYVFVHQFKQSFGIYLNQLKTKDSNIDLIIGNTDLFYKKYISSLEDNIKFYNDSIDSCRKMRKNNKNINEKIQPILNNVQQYWCNVVSHDIEHSDNYYTINSFIESVQKLRDNSFDGLNMSDLIDTILYLKKYDSEMIEKTQNYSFVDKWNEIVNKKELVNKEDENISRYSFEIV